MCCIFSWRTYPSDRSSASISTDSTISQPTGRSTTPSPSASEPMDSILSEPPFFPKESTLSQLSFFPVHQVNGYDLPPRPLDVCQGCWEGPFTMRFGLLCVSPRDGQGYRDCPQEYRYSISLDELWSRARRDCVWCQFVHSLGGFCGWESPEWNVTIRGTTRNDVNWGHGQYYQEISLFINDTYVFGRTVDMTPDGPAASYIKARIPVQDVGSPYSLALAKQHIHECVQGHELCRSLASPSPFLPTRLVDCSNPSELRLTSTAAGDRGAYLALSYVWGGDQLYKSTKSTLSIYEHGVNSSIFPQTVRDAISVTNALGFRFLWVDALCIIQDDDADKRHEIAHMHDIYRYAHLTIIAASAENVNQGFLHVKRPLEEREIVLPFIRPPGFPTSVGSQDNHSVAQLQLGHAHPTHIDSVYRLYGDELGVMGTRAWCMQEYLMCPRALIFTSTRLRFSCRTTIQGVDNTFGPMRDEPRLPNTLFLRDPPVAKPGSKEWKHMRAEWTEVVKDYSRRRATVESDKLVACAAVAQQFARVLQSDYLAGLWRSEMLLADLLWEADPWIAQDLRRTRPKAYRAPSWSWAAIEGAVCNEIASYQEAFEDPRNIALADVVVSRCGVTLEDPSLPFGRVTGGTVVLRGTTIPYCGRGAERSGHGDYWAVPLPSFEQAQRQRWGLDGLHSDEEDEFKSAMPGGHVYVVLDCSADGPPERMWLVPFLRITLERGNDEISGIVLELDPTSHSSKSRRDLREICFRRIGHFGVSIGESSEDALWDPLTRAVQDQDSQLWMDIVIE